MLGAMIPINRTVKISAVRKRPATLARERGKAHCALFAYELKHGAFRRASKTDRSLNMAEVLSATGELVA